MFEKKFEHSSGARNNIKLKRLRRDFGIEGYGIFFMLLEILREEKEHQYPYKDIDLLADEFGTSISMLESIINNYGLFKFDENKNFYNTTLLYNSL